MFPSSIRALTQPHDPNPENDLPLYVPDEHATYSVEIVAKITGVSSQTILHDQEHGLIPASETLDDEAVHTLRRIEHLRQTCEANLSGLKLILDLTNRVEQLQIQLRARR